MGEQRGTDDAVQQVCEDCNMKLSSDAREKIRLELMRKLNQFDCQTCHDPLDPSAPEGFIVFKNNLYHSRSSCEPDPKAGGGTIDIGKVKKP